MPHRVNLPARPTPRMPRLIKRYGSRKLYDTSESRYVSLDEVAAFVRSGDEVRVVDNRTGDDATAAILTQIISEEGRNGTTLFSTGFLHDLLRVGERAIEVGQGAVEAGLTQARRSADEIARHTLDRIRPDGLSEVRSEVDRLRARLEGLEATLADIETDEPTL